ncbi:MAG: redoxin domain-containing protein [Bacteroidota bacterium]
MISPNEFMILPKGNFAPAFELPGTGGKKMSLSDWAGQRIILAFYPGDWSAVCSDQLTVYNEVLDVFRRYNAELLGISVDSSWSHTAFAESRNFHFPLLSDFEPKGDVSRMYGVYDEEAGVSKRALFVIDEEGIIQWSYLSPAEINPGADGILDALERLPIIKK